MELFTNCLMTIFFKSALFLHHGRLRHLAGMLDNNQIHNDIFQNAGAKIRSCKKNRYGAVLSRQGSIPALFIYAVCKTEHESDDQDGC